MISTRLGAKLGSEIDQVVDRQALAVECRRFAGNRLCRRRFFSRNSRCRYGALRDGPHRLTGRAIQHEGKCLLRDLDDGLDSAPADGDVDEDRCGGVVIVEQVVVHGLECHTRLPVVASRHTMEELNKFLPIR